MPAVALGLLSLISIDRSWLGHPTQAWLVLWRSFVAFVMIGAGAAIAIFCVLLVAALAIGLQWACLRTSIGARMLSPLVHLSERVVRYAWRHLVRRAHRFADSGLETGPLIDGPVRFELGNGSSDVYLLHSNILPYSDCLKLRCIASGEAVMEMQDGERPLGVNIPPEAIRALAARPDSPSASGSRRRQSIIG